MSHAFQKSVLSILLFTFNFCHWLYVFTALSQAPGILRQSESCVFEDGSIANIIIKIVIIEAWRDCVDKTLILIR